MTRTLRTTGADLAVFSYGAGDPALPTVLLLHGYPDDHHVFDPLIAELGDRVRVLAYDTRAAGRSRVDDPGLGSFQLPLLAEDLFTVAATAGGPVHLLAHDWGSVQAWEAMRDPRAAEAFLSYTSVSGPSVDHLREWNRWHLRRPVDWPTIAVQLLRSWYVFGFALPGVRRLVPPLFRAVAHADLAGRDLGRDPERGGELYRANILQRMLCGPAPRCDVPTTLVLPTRDRYLSPRLAEDVDTWASDLEVMHVEAGHWWPGTHPVDATALLLRRLGTTSTRPARHR